MAHILLPLAAAIAVPLSALVVFLLLVQFRVITPSVYKKEKEKRISVQILVLGDVGRSPRMQYHALSIAKHGGRVDLVGFLQSEVHPEVAKSPLISLVPMASPPSWFQSKYKLLAVLFLPLKALHQFWSCYRALAGLAPSEFILVQTPPVIPTVLIAGVVAYLRKSKLIIDWHNLGHTILALSLGPSHPYVALYRMLERSMARFSSCDFTVSDAMNNHLIKESYSRHCLTLYDRPPTHFQPLSEAQTRKFLERFEPSIVKDRQNTKLIVSSTSWTLDEDFSILLDALVSYSNQASKTNLPSVVAVITGKGPLKEFYLEKIRQLQQEKKLQSVAIRTEWLSNEDYALLLGSADLGVSLHKSSSGLDLPMKVVDMFGTGLPVTGFQYQAISELIEDGVNGRLFTGSEDLAAQLVELFQGGSKLPLLRKGAMKEHRYRWDDEWDGVAGRVFGFNTRETKKSKDNNVKRRS